MVRVLSGIRPTGKLHLGNYLGAVRQFKALQENPNMECFYFAADLHALTTISGPVNVRETTVNVIREYLACGLDPTKSVMYRQSEVPEITYLSTLLGMVAPFGRLLNCTTFKDKSAKQEKSNAPITAGLFNYPVLMAADILAVRGEIVPVGEDQMQHLEMSREFAKRFNNLFGTSLTIPRAQELEAIRVPGLDGSGKMGKSDGNTIDLTEDPKSILKKVKSAKTDLGPIRGQKMQEAVANLYYLLKLCSPPEVYQDYLDRYNRGEQKFYGQMKERLGRDIIALLEPIRDRYNSSDCSDSVAKDILVSGAVKARMIASEVLDDARNKIGL